MYCPNCGKENRDSNVYCEFCGEKLNGFGETKAETETETIGGDSIDFIDDETSSKPKKINVKKLIIASAAVVAAAVLAFAFIFKPASADKGNILKPSAESTEDIYGDDTYNPGDSPEIGTPKTAKDTAKPKKTGDGKKSTGSTKSKPSTKSTAPKKSPAKSKSPETSASAKEHYYEDKIVTASEYNSKYKNNSKYKASKVYRYATRSKSTTTSGHDSVSGYTKYDSKTSTTYSGYYFGTPISTSTSYSGGKKVTKSATNTGYYYYAYAAGNPNRSSEWSFFCAKKRSTVISHMKQNYSVSRAWSEDNLRYFWYISSSDLGSNPKGSSISRSIPYRSNSSVGVGTLTKDGNHYYDIPMYKYSRCYKVKTVTKTNYFYKWSSWSSWSDWTTNPPSASDSVKIDSTVKYRVQHR